MSLLFIGPLCKTQTIFVEFQHR